MGPVGFGLEPLPSFLLSCFGFLSLINQAILSYSILLNIKSFTTLAHTIECWFLLHCCIWVVAEVGWFSNVSRISRFWIFYRRVFLGSARVPSRGNSGFHSVLSPDVFATLRRRCILSDTAISCCLTVSGTAEISTSQPIHYNIDILYW